MTSSYRSRGNKAPKRTEKRPYVFKTLTVDGVAHEGVVTVPNTGQGIDRATRQAAEMVREERKTEEPSVPTEQDSAPTEESVPTERDSAEEKNPVSGSPSTVDVRQLLSPKVVGDVVIPWLQANLPSADQLMAASASMVSLIGVEQRTKDLLEGMRGGFTQVSNEFSSWFQQRQQEWVKLQLEVAGGLSDVQAAIAELTSWRSSLENELRGYVRGLRGPQGVKGDVGLSGAATTVVDRLPRGKGAGFTRAYLGRDAVVGDICIDGSTEMRYAWRWSGGEWERGPAMVTLQVRDVRISALDASTKQLNSITNNIEQLGGSGGGLPMTKTLNGAIPGVQQRLSDGGNFGYVLEQLGERVTAVKGFVELIAQDGPNAGETQVSTFSISANNVGDNEWVEAEILRDLGVNFELAIVQGAGSPPSWKPTAQVSATHSPHVEIRFTANTSGASGFFVKGWTLPALPTDATGRPLKPEW